jgi:hypothetical protein
VSGAQVGLGSASLRYALLKDTCAVAGIYIAGIVEASIRAIQIRRAAEYFLVTLQRHLYMELIRRVPLQDLVLGYQAVGTFSQKDLVAELNWGKGLASFDDIGVRLEDREKLLVVWNFLFEKHTASGLIHNTVAKGTIVVDLFGEGISELGSS